MSRIPRFERTVLPNRAQPGFVQLAGHEQREQAREHRQTADTFLQAQSQTAQTTQNFLSLKRAQQRAEGAVYVNEQAIAFERKLIETQDQMRQNRQSNPGNFAKDYDKDLQELAAPLLEGAPTGEARNALNTTIGRIRNRTLEENKRWENTRRVEMHAESLERAQEDQSVLAYRAGREGRPLDAMLNSVEASAMAGSTFVAPEKVAQIHDTMKNGVTVSYLEGMAETSPDKAKSELSSGKYDDVLSVDDIQSIRKMADGEINRRSAKVRMEIEEDFQDITSAAKRGLKVPDENLDGLIERTKSAGMEKQHKALVSYKQIKNDVEDFAVMPLEEQQKILDSTRAQVEGGDLSQADTFIAYDDVLQTKKELIRSNPYEYYAGHEIIKEPQPLPFEDPQALAGELDNRRVSAQTVKDMDGVTLPLFTKEEVAQLQQMNKNLNQKQMAGMINTLDQALDDREMQALSQAIAPGDPILATATAVQNPIVAERILAGSKVKGAVTEADFRSDFLEEMDGAIVDPVVLEQAVEGAYAYYKDAQVRANDDAVTTDNKRMDETIKSIFGGIVEVDAGIGYPSSSVLPYIDGETGTYVDEIKLNDILSGITNDQLSELNGRLPVGVTGDEFSSSQILRETRWVTNGDGKYGLLDNKGDFLLDPETNRAYTVDARELEKIQKRMPSRAKVKSIKEGF